MLTGADIIPTRYQAGARQLPSPLTFGSSAFNHMKEYILKYQGLNEPQHNFICKYFSPLGQQFSLVALTESQKILPWVCGKGSTPSLPTLEDALKEAGQSCWEGNWHGCLV